MAKGKYQEWLSPDGLLRLQGWARRGLTDEQIAQSIGISRSTLKEWKKTFPAISAALKKTKELVDDEVENALLQSAKGFEYEEEVWERVWNSAKGDFELVLTKKTKKVFPPSNTAQIFWLKNRRPELWRDKVESHMSVSANTATKTIAELITSPVNTRDISELIKEAQEDKGEEE
jgi:hypothetical protein